MGKIKIYRGNFKDLELPETIYKYRYWSDNYHKRFILKREIFLASPETFEDDLDCKIPTRYDLLNNEQIYNYFYWISKKENVLFTKKEHESFATKWLRETPIKDKDYAKKHMNSILKETLKRDGVLSLTEIWNNDSMWEKYSDNGKGFCIGYNPKIMFNFLGGGAPIEYVKEVPKIFPEPIMDFIEAVRRRIYCKLEKWKFEKEYRTTGFWYLPPSIKDRQVILPKSAFKRIILGDNISKSHRKEIIENVKKYIGDIEIVERKNAY